MLKGKSEYYIAENHNQKRAIFHKDNPHEPLSGWWYNIYAHELLEGKSECYIAENNNREKAIFHINNPTQPLTQWLDNIYGHAFLEGKSKYYIAQNQNKQLALFDINQSQYPVSGWWKTIHAEQLLQGKSHYYLAKHQNGTLAIFHTNNPYQPISQWWNDIDPYGLIEGTSDYYIATNQESSKAIFHKDYPDEPLSNWHNYIYPFGLLNNTSEYYAVFSHRNHSIHFYHPNDMSKPLYQISKVHEKSLLFFDYDYIIYVTKNNLVIHNNMYKKPDTIVPLPEDLRQNIFYIDYKEIPHYTMINSCTTNHLITTYRRYNFIPIVYHINSKYEGYLYTLSGDYIGKFNNVQNMIEYMQQEIAKKNSSCDMLRLY